MFASMGRGALVLLSLSVSLSALSACSILVKSDDLIDGPPAAAGEAGAGMPDANGGAVEGGTVDGGQGCGGKTLCDDFEGAGTFAWTPTMTGNASVLVDTVKPRGGARGLHALRAPAAGREAAYYAYDPPGTLRFCELDVFATSTTGDSFSVFNLTFGSVEAPFTSYSLSMQMGGSLAQFGGKSGSPSLYSDVYVPSLRFGAWKHVRIELDWASASPAILLSVDGAAEPRFPISPPKRTNPIVQIGMTYEAAQGAGWEVFVDNVVCATD